MVTLLCLAVQGASAQVAEFDVALYDTLRGRAVPLAVYAPPSGVSSRGVVIFSHGYGQNAPGSNKAYSYLTRELAAHGYFVISIQHELPEDDPLAMEEPFLRTRRANWERGVGNILFTIAEGRRMWPGLPWDDISLVGHSNGGDMTMLFAAEHPDRIRRVVSLDHRRMPMPGVRRPAVTTLRGCDYEADKGVLPDRAERRRFGIRVVRFADIRHGDMDDKGSPRQHARICREVLKALR